MSLKNGDECDRFHGMPTKGENDRQVASWNGRVRARAGERSRERERERERKGECGVHRVDCMGF